MSFLRQRSGVKGLRGHRNGDRGKKRAMQPKTRAALGWKEEEKVSQRRLKGSVGGIGGREVTAVRGGEDKGCSGGEMRGEGL